MAHTFAYESAEQQPKHFLTWEFLQTLLATIISHLNPGRRHGGKHRVRGRERGGLQRVGHVPPGNGHGLRRRDGPGDEQGQAGEETRIRRKVPELGPRLRDLSQQTGFTQPRITQSDHEQLTLPGTNLAPRSV